MVHREIRVKYRSERRIILDLTGVLLVNLSGTLQNDVGVREVPDLHVHDGKVVEHYIDFYHRLGFYIMDLSPVLGALGRLLAPDDGVDEFLASLLPLLFVHFLHDLFG